MSRPYYSGEAACQVPNASDEMSIHALFVMSMERTCQQDNILIYANEFYYNNLSPAVLVVYFHFSFVL
jgi:hypothetical protein